MAESKKRVSRRLPSVKRDLFRDCIRDNFEQWHGKLKDCREVFREVQKLVGKHPDFPQSVTDANIMSMMATTINKEGVVFQLATPVAPRRYRGASRAAGADFVALARIVKAILIHTRTPISDAALLLLARLTGESFTKTERAKITGTPLFEAPHGQDPEPPPASPPAPPSPPPSPPPPLMPLAWTDMTGKRQADGQGYSADQQTR